MRRICVIKSRRYPKDLSEVVDGGTLNVHRIVSTLKMLGCEVEVFTRSEAGTPAFIEQDQETIIEVPFRRSRRCETMARDYEEGLSFVNAVVHNKHFDPHKYNIIHIHHWTSGVNLCPFLPYDSQIVFTPHLLAPEKARHNGIQCPPEAEAAERAIVHRSKFVFALSNAEKEAVIGNYGVQAEKVVVAPNGVDRSFFEVPPIAGIKGKTLSLLCIGRICKQKGNDVLLDAAEALLRRNLPVKVTLAGSSYGESEYEQMVYRRIKSPHLIGRVILAGQIAHTQIPRLLSQSSFYVQPSRYESQGVALLEAMAAERIVVASDLPAVREYISHGKNGLLVGPGNGEALADALCEFHSNSKYAENLARSARESARSFTWDNTLDRTISLLAGGSLT